MSSRLAGVTRWFLYLLIASIAIGAVLAIIIVLGGNWGWFESQVLLTTGVIAGASVLGMACAAASGRSGSWLPLIGVGLAAVGAALLIFGIWVGDLGDAYWRSTASICILAAAAAWSSVVSLARLTPGHQWSQWLAGATAFVFALMVVGIIFGEPSGDVIFRALAVVGIVTAASGLLVPVFHFLDRHAFAEVANGPMSSAEPTTLEDIDTEIAELRQRIEELEARRSALGAGG